MYKLTHVIGVTLLCLSVSPYAENVPDKGGELKIISPPVSETLTLERKSISVLGSKITYLESGKGDPVLFIHGNPTSSYLWRNVIPHVAGSSRAIAIDLIGMGHSDKPDIDYTFKDHYRYFSAYVDAMNLKNITLVGHDWGAAIAWEYARNNPQKVNRLAFMEGVLPPGFPVPSFESMGEEMGGMFQAFKDPVKGHELVIENNMFIEQVLPGFVNRSLGAEAMQEYRAPYLSAAARKPVLAWPRQVPIAGQPEATVNVMGGIKAFMQETQMPILLLYAAPGAIPWYVQSINNIETSFVGVGLHFIQEDPPGAIGMALNDWKRRN